jgi:hypothetical protein
MLGAKRTSRPNNVCYAPSFGHQIGVARTPADYPNRTSNVLEVSIIWWEHYIAEIPFGAVIWRIRNVIGNPE